MLTLCHFPFQTTTVITFDMQFSLCCISLFEWLLLFCSPYIALPPHGFSQISILRIYYIHTTYISGFRKKKITLLSGTSKNCGGQVNSPTSCARDNFTSKNHFYGSNILSLSTFTLAKLRRSMKMLVQADLWATCPLDKWNFFHNLEPCIYSRVTVWSPHSNQTE